MSERFDDLFQSHAPRLEEETVPNLEPDEEIKHTLFQEPTSSDAPPTGKESQPILGLAPGAQWETKQWPENFFAEVLTGFRRSSSAPVRIFLGPREELWFSGSHLEGAVQRLSGIQVIRGLSLTDLIGPITGCSVLLTNDSGLLHLAEAAGTPVLALFGPTVREFGYFPRLPESRVLEISLDCRPCSRNGKRPCHRKDLACLASISPAEVLQAVLSTTTLNGRGSQTVFENLNRSDRP